MGKWKIYYFDARGRAEIIRMTCKAAKIDFEDIRFTREEWPEYKKKSPSGQAPWVESESGCKMTQSMAIARMFAHDAGLLGKDSCETYLIERAIGQLEDLGKEMMKIFFTADEAEKEKLRKEVIENQGENHMAMIDKFLEEGKGHLAAGRFTLADIYLLNTTDYVKTFLTELYEKHPKLGEHYERICQSEPALGDWIKERPKTQF